VSFNDTDEETSKTKASAGNRTDGGRGTDSDAVTALCREKYKTDSKNMTSADIKYFLLERLSTGILS